MVAAIVGLDARPGTTEYQLARETPPPFAGRVRSQRPQHGSMVVTAHRVSSLLGVLLICAPTGNGRTRTRGGGGGRGGAAAGGGVGERK